MSERSRARTYGMGVEGAATRGLLRNPRLRALLVAWGLFYTGDYAYLTLVYVFTFSASGAAAMGAATVLNVLPGGLLGPLAAALATSRRPQLHLAVGIGARALATVVTIIAVLNAAPVGVVLALVGADSAVSAAVRPLHGALVVRLADNAAEAAAANAASSSLLSAGTLAGPALAGLALEFLGIGWAFALPTAIFTAGAAAASLIMLPRTDGEPEPEGTQPSRRSGRRQLIAAGAGFRAILSSRPASAATGLFTVSVTLVGIFYVASASLAADDRWRLGEGGIALIMTIFGGGGLFGALATLSIVGRRGLARAVAWAMFGWVGALAAISAIILPSLGLALAAGAGAAGAVVYAITPTLVQRSVTRDAMVPAAASVQTLYLVGIAAGGVIAPALIDSVGVAAALAIVAGSTAVVTLLAWPQLRRADALSAEDAAKLAVIRATPQLAPLPARALEQLARAATCLAVPTGSDVVRQDDPGDRFYIIGAGLADVTVDGRRVAALGPGGSFGEIALLHDMPRSATVTAREDLDLVAIDRADFLGALSSDPRAVGRIGAVAHTRLGTPPVEERLAERDRDAALRGRSVTELLAPQPPLATFGAGALRALADEVRVVAAPAGTLLIRAGDYGDTYYVILDGAAEVFEDETPVRNLGPGDGFGERAILRDIPRTATVRAVGDTTLVAVDREAFEHAKRAR
jgi:CRP-like cAMP-binding protein/predicted MFS family arabinose efflux permease